MPKSRFELWINPVLFITLSSSSYPPYSLLILPIPFIMFDLALALSPSVILSVGLSHGILIAIARRTADENESNRANVCAGMDRRPSLKDTL
jgi:hypothetical protein